MKEINIQQYNTRFPKLNEEYFDSLLEEDKGRYLKRLSKYYSLLSEYLLDELKLDEIESSLKNSENKYIPIYEEEMDMYQFLSFEKLSYFYVRNNIYIERLNEQALGLLDSLNENLDSASKDFIEKTFRHLIDDYPNQNLSTNYGPDALQFFTNSSNLILGIRINEAYYPQGVDEVECMEKRDFEIDFIADYISAKTKKVLNMDSSVIRYNFYSVKRINEGEISYMR